MPFRPTLKHGVTWHVFYVFINDKGQVFICCHSRPEMIGDIYKESLKAIWTQSSKLEEIRAKSINGTLECAKTCIILTENEKRQKVNLPAKSEYPKKVWMLYGTFCNQKCIMCWQDVNSRIALDNDILKKHIDWTPIEEIVLQGGEILAMKGAKELYLWFTQELNKKVDLITNGMLISDKWAEYLIKGSNKIIISVNAATKEIHELINHGSKYDRVITNIRKLISLKNELNLQTKIIFKYTTIRKNLHEMADAVDLADHLGCDEIWFGVCRQLPPYLEENQELKERLTRDLSSKTNECFTNKINKLQISRLGINLPF